MWYGFKRLPPKASSSPTPPGSNATIYRIPTAGMKEMQEKSTKRAIDTLVEGQAAANRVAELTGGWTSFLETPQQAGEIYARILADINHQYVIGYYPSNKEMDGTLRTVRIELRGHPDYLVQGRRSYYAMPRQ